MDRNIAGSYCGNFSDVHIMTPMTKEHPFTSWRKSQTLKQSELAEKLGVSVWMVSQLETGRRTPSFELAIKIERLSKGEVRPMDFAKPDEN